MFRFKQFTIHQDRTPMKVGTDGVLLGAWADIHKATSLLDIGTGTGLIALMSAQRNPTVNIDALEIEPNAFQQACENILSSPWSPRIHIYPVALQDFRPSSLYDSIVCNPPYFTHSTKAPDSGRTLARHNDTLSLQELLLHGSKLLSPKGNFCVILPVTEATTLLTLAKTYLLYPTRITRVLPNPGKLPKRILVQLEFSPQPFHEEELIVEYSRHRYSQKYIDLTEDFYLKLEGGEI